MISFYCKDDYLRLFSFILGDLSIFLGDTFGGGVGGLPHTGGNISS